MKIAIIGTGVYSTALTYVMQKVKDNEIYLWTEQEALIPKFKKTRKFDFLSKKIKFDSNVNLTNSLKDALEDASIIFILVASKYFKETIDNIKHFYKRNTPIIVGTKGIDLQNKLYFSDYTRTKLKCNSYTFFAGPTFANELLLDYPIFLTFAGSNKIGYKKINRVFPNIVNTNFINDLYGLELCAVLKNIYAIGSGILTGLKVSDSYYYSYITKVILELENLLKHLYGDSKTILTYGGIGDLLMTLNSKNSRNFTLGKMISTKDEQNKIEKYIKETTIEGYENLKYILNLIPKSAPNNLIIQKIYKIIYENEDCNILISNPNEEEF